MKCPKCGSENVSVQVVQAKAKTSQNSRGCMWKAMRVTLIICTCGLWLLVGKSKGSEKMKFKNESHAVCQNCGNRWKA